MLTHRELFYFKILFSLLFLNWSLVRVFCPLFQGRRLEKMIKLYMKQTKTTAKKTTTIDNNSSTKWRWVVVLLYTKTVRKYTPQKFNLDDSINCHGYKPGRHFFPICLEANSTGYSEFGEPIRARLQGGRTQFSSAYA